MDETAILTDTDDSTDRQIPQPHTHSHKPPVSSSFSFSRYFSLTDTDRWTAQIPTAQTQTDTTAQIPHGTDTNNDVVSFREFFFFPTLTDTDIQ